MILTSTDTHEHPAEIAGDRSAPVGGKPVRTCIGCREASSQAGLLRMVADTAGRVRMEGSRRQPGPGRGAYVHARRDCMNKAARREALGRAFKRNIVNITGDALWSLAQAVGGAEIESRVARDVVEIQQAGSLAGTRNREHE